MNYLIWNFDKNLFWNEHSNEWSNKYYASTFTEEELEGIRTKFIGNGNLVLALPIITLS